MKELAKGETTVLAQTIQYERLCRDCARNLLSLSAMDPIKHERRAMSSDAHDRLDVLDGRRRTRGVVTLSEMQRKQSWLARDHLTRDD